MSSEDQLVKEYLRRLRKAAAQLPRGRRRELLADIEGHIAAARNLGSGEAYLRNVLDALGDPEDIVAASLPPSGRSAPRTRDVIAVVMLVAGGLVIPIVGWFIGVVLLWSSDSWTTGSKLLGTFIWPGGLGLVWFLLGMPSGVTMPQWLGFIVLALLVISPLIVAVDLLRHARSPRAAVNVPFGNV